MKVLVAGWFSFDEMGATAGDLLARDVVCRWLDEAAVPYAIATAPPFGDGVDWRSVDPSPYRHVVFVCGPFGNGWPLTDFLPRFAHCRLVGVDLSVLQPLDEWNPFDLLLERDSSRTARPDIAFLSDRPLVPVVGLYCSTASPTGRRTLNSPSSSIFRAGSTCRWRLRSQGETCRSRRSSHTAGGCGIPTRSRSPLMPGQTTSVDREVSSASARMSHSQATP